MKQLSWSIVFVDSNKKDERIAVLKDKKTFKALTDDDTDVLQKSLIDRSEFAATYKSDY